MPSLGNPNLSYKSVRNGGSRKVRTSENASLGVVVYYWIGDATLILSSFAFAYDDEVEPGLVAFVRLLVFDFEWSRAQKKGKLPTTMLDKKVGEVLEKIISDREAGYGQTIQVSNVI
jgi:SET domain-containing protein 6